MSKNYNWEEKFWSRVDNDGPTMSHMDTNCWVITKGFTTNGYGRVPFCWEGRRAHRYSYYLNVDENFDRSKDVCHRCDNPKCVRPSHLFLGTEKDNVQDMFRKGRSRGQRTTHCPQGHEYTKENTYVRKNSKKRECLTCKRESSRKQYVKKKALQCAQQQ